MSETLSSQNDQALIAQRPPGAHSPPPAASQTEVTAPALTEFRKLDVSVRETDYVAGDRNLTAIVIRNTYPLAIKLTSVAARHSRLNSVGDTIIYRGSFQPHNPPARTRTRLTVHNVFGPFPWSRDQKGRRPLLEFFRQTTIEEREPLVIQAQKGSKIRDLDQDLPGDRRVIIQAEEGAEISFAGPQGRGETRRTAIISPMSEVVSEYTWKTKNWMLFIPSRLGIDIEVSYEIGVESRSQVVSTTFDIKPPIQSVVLGGIAGGFIGSLARILTEPGDVHVDSRLFIKLIGACLLSIMAVIALSRKSGTQSFITVEDFFGAFVLGSLIGYEGTPFFEKAVLNPNQPPGSLGPSPAPPK